MNIFTPQNVPDTNDRFVVMQEGELQRLRQYTADVITLLHMSADEAKQSAAICKSFGSKDKASKYYKAAASLRAKATALGKSQYAIKHQVLRNSELVAHFNAADISLVQTSTLRVDQAQINRADAWIKVCELLDELDPNWFMKQGTGLDLALNSIRGLAAKGKESA